MENSRRYNSLLASGTAFTNRAVTMNPAWQEWLQSSGARVEEGIVQHFGDPQGELEATRSRGVIADLSHLGVLDATGEDSETFLQGQLSCDVSSIGPVSSSYGSFCTPKGRMVANFLIWRSLSGPAAGFRMALSRELVAPVHKRLKMYVLRSQVQLSDVSDSIALFGVAGNGAAAAVDSNLSGLSPHESGRLDAGGVAIALTEGRYLLGVPADGAGELWTRVAAKLRPVGTSCWEWLAIRSGVPLITARTQEQFLPQMTNLELLGGVNFKKGCFTGQEVVARTQHLGKLKRRMFLAHVDLPEGDIPPSPGDETFSDDIPGQVSGMLVNAQAAPGGGYDLLAVIHQSSRESSSVHLRTADGPTLRFDELPYAVA